MADGVNPYVGAARAALGQGLGMGWGDEAEAWMRSKLGEDDYENLLKRIRSEYGAYSKEYPFTSGALEFAGGAVPGWRRCWCPGGSPPERRSSAVRRWVAWRDWRVRGRPRARCQARAARPRVSVWAGRLAVR